MLVRATIFIALIAFTAIMVLNSNAPAINRPYLQPSTWTIAADLPEMRFTDYTFVFVEGE
jgi:hypothetical protein